MNTQTRVVDGRFPTLDMSLYRLYHYIQEMHKIPEYGGQRMRYRRLGTSELHVSEIGLGCMSLVSDSQESERIISRAIDGGINFFDTADLYGQGENEALLGRCLAGRRQDVYIATKVGNIWTEGKSGWTWNPTKSHLQKAVHDSLRRLQTDYIDLYQLHGGTLDDPIDELIETFESLKQSGIIRHYGISSIRPNVIREYLIHSQLVSVMMQYNILDRRPEEHILESIKNAHTSVIARGPLARGALTSNYTNKANDSSYADYARSEIFHLMDRLRSLPEFDSLGHTGIALGYVLYNPTIATVIPGTRTLPQLEDVLKVSQAALSPASVQLIQQWSKPNAYASHR